jgi:hypothetical protein
MQSVFSAAARRTTLTGEVREGTPRFTLAPSRLAPATSKPFARAN